MKKEAIKQYIYTFWENKLEDVRERLVNMNFLKNDMINDIVGVRRSGKTYLMYYIAKNIKTEENFIYLNCEDRKLYPLKLEDLNYLIEFIYQENLLKKRLFLMLDEIQTVKGWEIFAKSIYDEFKGKIKLIVSGSVRSLLSEDCGKLLSGRHKTIEIFPLSFKELLHFKGVSNLEKLSEEKEAKIKKYVKEYIQYGGFPKYVLSKDFSYVEVFFSDITERDIKSRTDIRKKDVVNELINLFIERISCPTSFTKIRNILKNKECNVSTDLIIRYSSIFENVFLFFFLPVYSSKYSETIKNPKKIYVIDNGFFNLFYLRFSENIGRLMENTVALELLKRGNKIGKNLFYAKGNNYEIDFVIKDGLKVKQLIQVCLDIKDETTKKREVKGLLEGMKRFHLKSGLIITEDYFGEEKIKGNRIRFVPLWMWLLD